MILPVIYITFETTFFILASFCPFLLPVALVSLKWGPVQKQAGWIQGSKERVIV